MILETFIAYGLLHSSYTLICYLLCLFLGNGNSSFLIISGNLLIWKGYSCSAAGLNLVGSELEKKEKVQCIEGRIVSVRVNYSLSLIGSNI